MTFKEETVNLASCFLILSAREGRLVVGCKTEAGLAVAFGAVKVRGRGEAAEIKIVEQVD